MAATLINVFNVPLESDAAFLATWRQTTAHFSAGPGFIETHFHKNTGIGNQTFQYINVARWESAQAWKDAHDSYSPPEARIPGVKGHPAIFECVVDKVSTAGVKAKPGTVPTTLMNVFVVPADRDGEFIENWTRTTKRFSGGPGFIETHLHRNTGVGNDTFRYINIALWTTGDAWKTTHDDYMPTEYSIPGVKGHPSIYRCIIEAYREGVPPRSDLPFIQRAGNALEPGKH